MRVSTPSMRWVAAARLSISVTDFSVRWPACSTTSADWRTCRPISSIEADNCSEALATAKTLLEACSVARAAEGLDGSFNLPRPFLARPGVHESLRTEVAVAIHRVLEDADGAGQRAD